MPSSCLALVQPRQTRLCMTENVCIFVLFLYVSVDNFSVISGRFPVLLALTSTKIKLKCLTQGLNALSPVSLEPATVQSQV